MRLTNKSKTHCPKGHLFEGKNLVLIKRKDGLRRRCRTCLNAINKKCLNNRLKNPIININKSSCSQGHKFTQENSYISPHGYCRCRICMRISDLNRNRDKNRVLKRKYGITITDYNLLLVKQNNRCAICYTNNPGSNKWGNNNLFFPIDHDHKTGKVRGLLCFACNSLLGLAKDSTSILHSAIGYIDKSNISLE